MADAVETPEMSASFQITYDGSDAPHAMDVALLAPALLAFGDIVREANDEINGGRSQVRLLVESDFERKCFHINLDLVMSLYEHVKAMLQMGDVRTAQDILIWLGIFGVPTGGAGAGLLKLLKIRRGRQIKSVTRIDDPNKQGMVSIEIGDGAQVDKIEVHNTIYHLGENKKVLQAVARTIQPISADHDFDRIEFAKEKDGTPETIISRDDAADIQKTCDVVTRKR